MKNLRVWDIQENRYREDVFFDANGRIVQKGQCDEHRFVIEESIGLKDKHGNPIFNGDYVEGSDGVFRCVAYKDRTTIFKIEDSEIKPLNNTYCCGMGFIRDPLDESTKLEIKSNIHQPRKVDISAEQMNAAYKLYLKALEVLEFKLKQVAIAEAEKLKNKLEKKSLISSLFLSKKLKELKATSCERWLNQNMFERKHVLQYLLMETVYAVNKYNHFYCDEFKKIKELNPLKWMIGDEFISYKNEMEHIMKYSFQYTKKIQDFNDAHNGTVKWWGEK